MWNSVGDSVEQSWGQCDTVFHTLRTVLASDENDESAQCLEGPEHLDTFLDILKGPGEALITGPAKSLNRESPFFPSRKI